MLYAITCSFSISAAQISLGIAFFGFLYDWRRGRVGPRPSPLETPFACFALAGLLSIGNAVEPLRAIIEMNKFLIILVFWMAFWPRITPDRHRHVLAAMVFCGAASSVIGVLKLIYFDTGVFRTYGFFSLPITFGEIQTMLALTALGWLTTEEPSRPLRLGMLLSFFFLGIGILTSFTRGAWLGFLVGFIILLVRHFRRLFPIALVLGIGVIASMGISSGIHSRLESFTLENNFFRLRIWQIGFDILETNPVFGVGMNNVKPLYKDRVRSFDIQHNEVHGHLHNTFMQVLVMTGFFGFTCFCWFLARVFLWIRGEYGRRAPTWAESMAGTMLPLLAAFLTMGLTEYNFGDEEVAMLFFFLLGFLGNQGSRGSGDEANGVAAGNTMPTAAS